MNMTYIILSLTVSYALIAAMLTFILLHTRIHWVFKALSTMATVLAIPVTFWGVGELRGLPSDGQVPSNFRMLWAEVVEPNTVKGQKGHIYLWLLRLDSENFPVGLPRAYQLPYSEDLQIKVNDAMGDISDGENVQGVIDSHEQLPESAAEALAEEIQLEMSETRPGGSLTAGERLSNFDPSMLNFGTEAAPITPAKAP